MWRLLLVIICCAVAVSSCKYDNDEINYLNLSPLDEAAGIIIRIENEDDTVIVKDQKYEFGIMINTGEFPIVDVNIYNNVYDALLNKVGYINAEGRGTLRIQDLHNGLNELFVQVSVSSNTGSIAELSGEEIITYKKPFYVKKLPRYNPTPVIYSKIENGKRVLFWDKYEQTDFVSYELIKKYEYNTCVSDDGSNVMQMIIDNRKDTFYIDENYVEGPMVQYKLKYNISTRPYYSSADKEYGELSFKEMIPSIECDGFVNSSEGTISWDKTQFPNAFGSYKLFVDRQAYFTSDDPDEHTLPINDIPFGLDVPIDLYFTPKLCDKEVDLYKSSAYSNLYTEIKLQIGESMPYHPYREMYIASRKHLVVSEYPFKISIYEANGKTPIVDVSNSYYIDWLAVSEQGKYLVLKSRVSTRVVMYDTESYKMIYDLDYYKIFKSGETYVSPHAGSPVFCDDNGNVYMCSNYIWSYNYKSGEVNRYDYPSDVRYGDIKTISSSGKYCITVDGDCYALGSKSVLIKNGEGSLYFDSQSQQLIDKSEQKVLFYDLKDGSLNREYSFEGKVDELSPCNKYVVHTKDNNSSVYSFESDADVFAFKSNSHHYTVLEGSYIYCWGNRLGMENTLVP